MKELPLDEPHSARTAPSRQPPPRQPPVKLVIFDCDGVLIDSEVLACGTAAETMTEFGYAISLAEYLQFVGRSARDIRAELEARFGPMPPDLATCERARLFARFTAELQAMPGAAATIGGLGIGGLGLPVCVASSSDHERLAHTLGLTGLLDLFRPNVFSATEVARGKPAPDLFLHAAGRMGVAPAGCLVVEDSTAGVTAAVAAGMRAVGFVGGSHCGPAHADRLRAAGAERIIDRLSAVTALVR
ncbi:haloacid dehalogenase [Allostella vacuolata]|nr:haloacid dehalogenase [Stella vacuolata]